MGRFKEENTNYLINNWLENNGYKYTLATKGHSGMTRIYHTEDQYNVWVTINIHEKKVYLYKAYDCGGMVSEGEINIKDCCLDDLDTFINILDKELEPWIG